MEHVVIFGIIECDAKNTGQRVFIIITQYASVLVMSGINTSGHSFLISVQYSL